MKRVLIAALLLAASPSFAEDATDEITVYATRTAHDAFDVPAMVSVVDTNSASLSASATVKDMLADIGGLEFNGSARRTGQDIIMRGYSGQGVLVMFDGIPQNFESSHDGKFFIDPLLVKRVEVVRGPYSALYGSGGLGGIVAMETKKARDLLQGNATQGITASTGYSSVSGESVVSLAGYQISGGYDIISQLVRRTASDIELSDNTTLPNDDAFTNFMVKATSGNSDSGFTLSLHSVTGTALEPDNPQEILSARDVNQDKQTNAYTARIGYHGNPDNNLLNWRASVYTTSAEISEKADQTNGNEKSRTHNNVGLMADNQMRFDNATLIIGGQFFTEELSSTDGRTAFINHIPDAEAQHTSFFAQGEIAAQTRIGNFFITPGVRIDAYESSAKFESEAGTMLAQNESATSTKLGIAYRPLSFLNLFANYGQGFRAPDLSEIYATGLHFAAISCNATNFCTPPNSAGSEFVVNPKLTPEKNTTTEFGFGLDFDALIRNDDNLRFKAIGYSTKATDYIERYVDSEVQFTPILIPRVQNGRPVLNPRTGAPVLIQVGQRPTIHSNGNPLIYAGKTYTVNVDEAMIEGFDVEASYRIGAVQLDISHANAKGVVVKKAAQIDSGTNEIRNGKLVTVNSDGTETIGTEEIYLNNIAPATTKLTLAGNIHAMGLSLGIRTTIADDYTDIPPRGTKVDGYTIYDLFAQWQATPDLLLNFAIANASDVEYRRSFAGTAAPAQNIRANVSYKW